MATQDFYQVLGVPDTADAAQIKKAYRKLAKQYHPDANPGDPKAAERFKEISEANTVLSDPEQRSKYDRMRRLGAFDPGVRAGSTRSRPRGSAQEESFDFGDVGSFGLGDIFSSIFGKRRSEEAPQRPEHAELTVKLPFRTAAVGGKVPVVLAMNDSCATCGGSGAAVGAKLTTCAECGGRGTISFGQGGFAVNRPCPACRGRGQVPSQPCPTCGGSGEQRTRKELLVTVPPATDTGTRVRLKGQGPRLNAGGKASDVLVTFEVEPDRFFGRSGLDITCEIPVALEKAVLGATVQVKTVHGARVKLKIPPGTQPGRKFRIRGQGLEKQG
ncbi:MAG TPA: DnaJ domain-containing protein, partial [Gemmatimonadales bacterium]|nr:DnaJ domain-containing protein [Gemmatimonadales bacterium]